MQNQKLTEYIQQQLSQGISKEIIISTLINSGWQKSDIEEAFSAIPNSSQVNNSSKINSNFTSKIITEKDCPIETRWIIKDVIKAIPVIFLFVAIVSSYILDLLKSVYNKLEFSSLLEYYLFSTIGLFIFIIFSLFWRRKNYHYSINDKFLYLKQGVFSKQERNIPYGVIQNVFLKQGIIDRIINLASLTIENASQGGGTNVKVEKFFGMTIHRKPRSNNIEMLGFSGNKVSIPGLNKQNAEMLKNIILQKMKENPIEDSQSGL